MEIEKIRTDFPVLGQKVNGKPIIYMDSACMSLKPQSVIKKMNEGYLEFNACAGRSNHSFGSRMTDEYESARETISKSIGARNSEVIFTRNTTEGLNLVAHSIGLKKGQAVITSDREHNSNLVPWQMLDGVNHKIIPSKSDGTFDIDAFEKAIDSSVKLVSVVHSSNLDGYTLPVKEIIRISHQNGIPVMLDAAQSMPHKEVNVRDIDADFIAFSGHKMLGPYGTGILYGRYNFLEKMNPFMTGGETVEKTTYESHTFLKPPQKFEAGLQNYSGLIGLAEAVRYLERIGKENIRRHEEKLNRIITQEISNIDGLNILGPKEPEKRSGIISFTLKGMGHHEAAIMLDKNANIMVRAGQHCVHSWFNARGIEGSIRASLYLYNTEEEASIFAKELSKIAGLR